MASESEGRQAAKEGVARALGVVSLALGVPQTAAPAAVGRLIGVRDSATARAWLRVVGVRELVAAGGLLVQRRPVEWLWARAAGDVMDLALLATALAGRAKRPERTLAATAAVTVRKPRQELYAFWHDFANLPRFMAHLEAVEARADGRSHWRAKGPFGSVEWEAETVEDRPGEAIAWRSLPGATVANSGTVRFLDAPGDRGTEVVVELSYHQPGGRLGAVVAKLVGEEPHEQVKDDLRRFKQVMETGEVVRSDASPEGILAGRQLKQRPAQPLPEPVDAKGARA
jgi:uncharacterized membrane protein